MSDPIAYGDAFNAPFWEGAVEGRLRIQLCSKCHRYQFYGRPFCLACEGDVEWVEAKGTGTVYSLTTVRRQLLPEPEVPYMVAIVELDEGPRMLSNIEGEGVRIGDRVEVAWRQRADIPPLPIFRPAGSRE